MSDENEKPQRLTVKEQKFVATIVSGNSQTATEAVRDAGYAVTSVKSAQVMANQMLKKRHIQNALSHAIEKRFPDVAGVGAEMLYNMMQDPNESSAIKLKALDTLIKVCGWAAPTKSVSLNGNVGNLVLPGEEGDES